MGEGLRPVRLLWAVVVNSVAMAADGYDLMTVDLLSAIITALHPDDMTPSRKGFLACMAYVGVVTGMLLFGRLVDKIGVKNTGMLTSFCCVLGCALCAGCHHGWKLNMFFQLGLCRFVLGLGIGGEYPVSAALACGKRRASQLFRTAGWDLGPLQISALNMVFFQTGSILAPLLGTVMLDTELRLDVVWRVLVLVGMLPSFCSFLGRTQLPSVTEGVEEDVEAFEAGQSPDVDVLYRDGALLKLLVGISLAAGLQNFIYFGQGSFRSLMDEKMFHPRGSDHDILAHHATFGLFLTLISFTSCAVLVWCINHIPFFWGLIVCFSLFGVLAGLSSLFLGAVSVSTVVLLIMFCAWTVPISICGVLVYSMSAKPFPSHLQGTASGIAMAVGKAGALLGTSLFPSIEHRNGMSGLMLTCCLTAVCAVLVTMVAIPRNQHSTSGDCKGLKSRD